MSELTEMESEEIRERLSRAYDQVNDLKAEMAIALSNLGLFDDLGDFLVKCTAFQSQITNLRGALRDQQHQRWYETYQAAMRQRKSLSDMMDPRPSPDEQAE